MNSRVAATLARTASRIADFCKRIYIPLFVAYVVITAIWFIAAKLIGVPEETLNWWISGTIVFATIISILSVIFPSLLYNRIRRLKSYNPGLRLLQAKIKLTYFEDDAVELAVEYGIRPCREHIDVAQEFCGWTGNPLDVIVGSSFGGNVVMTGFSSFWGTHFEFKFAKELRKGVEHRYGYTLRFPNEDGRIGNYIIYTRDYAPEVELDLGLEVRRSGTFQFKRSIFASLTSKTPLKDPEEFTGRAHNWRLPFPRHKRIYHLAWAET